MTFSVVPWSARLSFDAFSCGEAALDRYARERLSQDIKRRMAAGFVALEGKTVAGYYTLAGAGIPLDNVPEDMAKRLPRYPVLPAIRLGRLAVDERFQGQGLGGLLLLDALERALRSDVAGFAMIVDAKNEKAAAFYEHFGFLRFEDKRRMLFLPLATAAKALGSPGKKGL